MLKLSEVLDDLKRASEIGARIKIIEHKEKYAYTAETFDASMDDDYYGCKCFYHKDVPPGLSALLVASLEQFAEPKGFSFVFGHGQAGGKRFKSARLASSSIVDENWMNTESYVAGTRLQAALSVFIFAFAKETTNG
jgi:hypothetical protein